MRLASALLLTLLPGPALSAPAPFKGESCQVCHAAIRDAAKPGQGKPAQYAGRYDVVVVGGGLAGLTAAHFLKERRVLVLEKEDRPGGKTRRDKLGRWSYSVGAVYTSDPDGMIGRLYKELGIRPVKFKLPVHEYWTQGRRVREWISKEGIAGLAEGPEDLKNLQKLIAELHELESSGKIAIPIQESDPKTLEEYDRVSFQEYLEKNFGPHAAALGDHYAKDVFGAGAKDVSAAMGLFYMASELTDSYGWPGGLGVVSEALAKELGPAVRTGCLVEEVLASTGPVPVTYLQGGKRYSVTADAVVLAVPSMVARRIVNGLSPEKERALAAVRYSSYAVIPMRFRRPVYTDAFVLWTGGLPISDFTFPGGDRLEGPAPAVPGQLAAAYWPLGSSEGRKWLLAASDAEIEGKVRGWLEQVLPGASKELAEIRVVRWGHAMPLMGPGYLTKIQPKLREPEGRLFFAGVDLQAAAVEGAMFSGYQAAGQVKDFLTKK